MIIVVLAGLLTAPVAPAEIQNLTLPPQPAGGPTTSAYWALIIGIDNYYHGLPLPTAVRDALEVRDELAQRYGVRRERLIELLDEQATRRNIAYALFRLSYEAKPDDIVLIYFAGHAQYDKDGRLQWWLPVEGTPLTPETLLTDAAIQEELQGRKAKQVHLFHVMAGVAREIRLAAEEARRAAEEQARREAERLAREQAELAKRLAEEKARQDAEEQAKARAEQRSKPIEEARVRPFTPPPAGHELIGKDGAPMVLVPSGEFTMGGDSNDNPRHPVYLDAFYMDKYEVTTSHYAGFLKVTGRQLPYKWSEAGLVSHGARPVIGVTWDDADTYCRWAGKRLPTEAEWEKAARGTDGREYPWGNETPTPQHANFNKCCEWTGYGVLAIVGSLEAGRSPYGIYDLAGNVSEWVADWYGKTSYKYELDRNPKGPTGGEEKVVRGGSWFEAGHLQRSALRSRSYPLAPSTDRGFRCAQDAK